METKGNKVNQEYAAVRYVRNPDVVLREEDEDGGLLFNPDTSQVQLVNTTGLYIWKQLALGMELSTITGGLLAAFADAPADQAAADVREFIAAMIAAVQASVEPVAGFCPAARRRSPEAGAQFLCTGWFPRRMLGRDAALRASRAPLT